MPRSFIRECFASATVLAACCLVGGVAPRAAAQDRSPAGAADDVESLVRKGLEAYRNGKSSEAVALLQEAIGVIQRSGEKSLAAMLPPVPEGWTAEEPETSSGAWGAGGDSMQWTQVSRRYVRERDSLGVTVTFTNSPQILMGQKAMAQVIDNPQYLKMMNQDGKQKISSRSVKGWVAWSVVETGKSAEGIALGERHVVMVDVDGGSEEILDRFWKGIDFGGLAAIDAAGR
jgi:hypothetical protein